MTWSTASSSSSSDVLTLSASISAPPARCAYTRRRAADQHIAVCVELSREITHASRAPIKVVLTAPLATSATTIAEMFTRPKSVVATRPRHCYWMYDIQDRTRIGPPRSICDARRHQNRSMTAAFVAPAAFIYAVDVATPAAPPSRVSIWNNMPVAAAERRRRSSRCPARLLLRVTLRRNAPILAAHRRAGVTVSAAISPASYLSTWTRTRAALDGVANRSLSYRCNVNIKSGARCKTTACIDICHCTVHSSQNHGIDSRPSLNMKRFLCLRRHTALRLSAHNHTWLCADVCLLSLFISPECMNL